jgi:drug/metabolite transporter (DMT)-like permease
MMANGYLVGDQKEISWLGVVLGLLSAITYALFIWFSGKTAKQVVPITRSGIMLSGSFILVMLVFPPSTVILCDWRAAYWRRFSYNLERCRTTDSRYHVIHRTA